MCLPCFLASLPAARALEEPQARAHLSLPMVRENRRSERFGRVTTREFSLVEQNEEARGRVQRRARDDCRVAVAARVHPNNVALDDECLVDLIQETGGEERR